MIGRATKITLSLLAISVASSGFATSLLQVYQQALQNDPTYKGAEATYASTKENMPLAMANLLPTVAMTAGYNKANSGSSSSHIWTKTWGATLSQTLFNWSAFAGVSKAKASIRGALSTYQAARLTLIQSTIAAYLTVVQDAATVHYDHVLTSSLLQLLKQQQQKYKVGIIPITDVYIAQSNYDAQLAQNITDQNTLGTDIESLRAITNHAYPSIKGVGASLPLHSPNPNNMQTWVSTALKQNLDIMTAQALVDADKATVSGDRGADLPSITLNGSYQQTHFKNIHDKPDNPNVSSVGLNVNFPLFSGGSTFAQTRQDAFTQQADEQTLEATSRSTVSQTRSNYMAILAAISGVKAAKQAYVSASQSLKATRAGYQVGTSTISQVLTAMSDQTKAQNDIITNQIAYLNAIVALKQEAGILNDRDVKAISKILNKTVHLPDTLNDKRFNANETAHATMTDAQKQQKVAANGKTTSAKTTTTAVRAINKQVSTNSKATTYSIQLFVSNSQTRAKSFIQHYLNNNPNAYITQHVDNGQTYYLVMYGNYHTATQASQQIASLSPAVQRLKPWVRKNN